MSPPKPIKLRPRRAIPISQQHVGGRQDLHGSLGHAVDVVRVHIFGDQFRCRSVKIEVDFQAAVIEGNEIPVLGAVVEECDSMYVKPPRIKLIVEVRRGPTREISEGIPLPAQNPQDLSRLAVNVRHGMHVPTTHYVIPLRVFLYVIDVEDIERPTGRAVPADRAIGVRDGVVV